MSDLRVQLSELARIETRIIDVSSSFNGVRHKLVVTSTNPLLATIWDESASAKCIERIDLSRDDSEERLAELFGKGQP